MAIPKLEAALEQVLNDDDDDVVLDAKHS